MYQLHAVSGTTFTVCMILFEIRRETLNVMVPTGTGKPGKMGRHREFYQDWKGQGILLKILEK